MYTQAASTIWDFREVSGIAGSARLRSQLIARFLRPQGPATGTGQGFTKCYIGHRGSGSALHVAYENEASSSSEPLRIVSNEAFSSQEYFWNILHVHSPDVDADSCFPRTKFQNSRGFLHFSKIRSSIFVPFYSY